MTKLRTIYREFDGFRSGLEQQITAFHTDHQDIAVEIEALEVSALYEKMVARRGCLTDQHDLFLAVTDWLPELIRDRLVVPLDDQLRDDPPPGWPDAWPPSLRHLQKDAAGKVYGLPYHNGPEVFMYRTDLFTDPAEQRWFQRAYGRDLAPPATWSEFLQLARFFTRPDDDLYGCVVAGKPDGHNDVYDFLIHLWSRGGEFLTSRNEALFASPEGEDALRYYVSLIHEHRVTQPEPWLYDSVAAGDFYASGRAAMMWNWCGFQTVADLPATSAIPGCTRSVMLPGGDGPQGTPVSLIVYWVMTLPAGGTRQDAAWRFLRHLATPEMDKITAFAGGSGTRRSTWDDPEVRRTFGYYASIEEIHRQARTLPAIPEYPAINDVIDRMMARVIHGNGEIPALLAAAQQEVEEILATRSNGHRPTAGS